MGHKCFISFKTEDSKYKKEITDNLDIDFIDKSLNEPIKSDDEDYILQKIRSDYLADSSVIIFLIGEKSAENLGKEEQKFIKRELQASLYNGKGNTRNGLLGVVLPNMYSKIYRGSNICSFCDKEHNLIAINDSIVIKEFSYNYYIPNEKCSHAEDDRYCVLVKWEDFKEDPEKYIEKAFEKRSHPISKKVKVYP
ncbi:TIR domain-containing protein [Leptospira sp. 201903074]|uniref:TIR domain-containing protein n=1 Tax=Leptospira abararensis TaxID=2810036 RepID=UPI001963548C|nr:TIR domain-containing protein [Leptospira abararensis]MBM9547398.1 TIR domain-containing protein [Leptospira abararensis]